MIQLVTFGGCSVISSDGDVRGAATQVRRLALLAVLARAGEKGISRARLINLFWADDDEEKGRKGLTQAVYALRRDLGNEGVIVGAHELRLDPELLPSDVHRFAIHLRNAQYAEAVAQYAGPFLAGFHLVGAPAFERWADEERTVLQRDYAKAVERLAKAAEQKEDYVEAVQRWRALAATDPLDSRVTLSLMRALTLNGEHAAAIRQAAIHEALLQQELELGPDREVVAYAATLREQLANGTPVIAPRPAPSVPEAPVAQDLMQTASADPQEAATPSGPPVTTPLATLSAAPIAATNAATIETTDAAPSAPAAQQQPVPTQPPTSWLTARRAMGFAALFLLAIIAVGAIWMRNSRTADASDVATTAPMIAVGRIVDYRERTPVVAGSLVDMLATSLARVGGLQVLSNSRMLELHTHFNSVDSTDRARAAAEMAGAAELLEGGVQPLANGRMVLELRRVSVANGAVLAAYRFEGADPFALVTDATDAIARAHGQTAPTDNASAFSTRSLVALRFFEEGLRAYARGDMVATERLMGAALGEDPQFAMAAFKRYQARSLLGAYQPNSELFEIVRLSETAPERERLMIRAHWALWTSHPSLRAVADTLAIRFPNEPEASYLVAQARIQDGDSRGALKVLDRLMEREPLPEDDAKLCRACDAMEAAIFAWESLDSFPRAEALALDWTRKQPQSTRAWENLAGLYLLLDRADESIAAHSRATSMTPVDASDDMLPILVRIRAGDFGWAEKQLTSLMIVRPDNWIARHVLINLRRIQGRNTDAERLLFEWYATLKGDAQIGAWGREIAWTLATIALENGQAQKALAIWDSVTNLPSPDADSGQAARINTMRFAYAASAAAQAGDAARAHRFADSANAWARRSSSQREVQSAKWARGMATAASGDTTAAIAMLRESLYWVSQGQPRTNTDLATLLIAKGRFQEAIPVARGAMRAPFNARSAVTNYTAARELLARAYEGAGNKDSARVHREWVARARQ